MSDHENFRALAVRMINKHGRNITLRTVTNTGDAWNPTQSNTDVVVKAVQKMFSDQTRVSGLVKKGDKRFVLVTSTELSPETKIIDLGQEFSILEVLDTYPGEQQIVYDIHATT